jgi:formylglycine-generating enzyme
MAGNPIFSVTFSYKDKKMKRLCVSCVAVFTVAYAVASQAVTIDMVTVGNKGNIADTAVMIDSTTGYGSVSYNYQIGKYEVTNAQYCEFLNATANITDPYHLFSNAMSGDEGGIVRTNILNPSHWTYDVKSLEWYSKPVGGVSFWSALRFCNWLQTGDTENGAYTLTPERVSNNTVSRNPDAKYYIPNENEWYKAAYYNPQMSGGPGYWSYPTRSNYAPDNNPPSADSGNSANYAYSGNPLFSPKSTNVGAYTLSFSPSGTFDQGGNVDEWVDSIPLGLSDTRLVRGGGWYESIGYLQSNRRDPYLPSNDYNASVGFRVASPADVVPEPGGIVLTLAGALSLLAYAWRRHKQIL